MNEDNSVSNPQPQPDNQPAPTPMPTPMATPTTTPAKQPSGPGQIALQWLSYAFWGWTIVTMAYLIAAITAFIIEGAEGFDAPEVVAYGVAALLILLPIAVVCDALFSRREMTHHSTATSVVMIIHTVLFTLVAIGALVVLAFTAVNMLLTAIDSQASTIAIVTSLTLFLLFGALIVRVARPTLHKWLRRGFRIKMVVIGLVLIVWAIAGPITTAASTKDDRAVTQAVQAVNSAIQQYTSETDELPDSIAQALDNSYSFNNTDTVDYAIEKGLVTYRANVKEPEANTTTSRFGQTDVFYELCATYSNEVTYDAYASYDRPTNSGDNGEYQYSLPDTAPAGTTCHKLVVSLTNSTPFYRPL